MKYNFPKLFFTFFLLSFYFVSCQQSHEKEIRNDLDQLESWLNERSEHIEHVSEQEWNKAQENYKNLQVEVENNFNQLSQETKDRYNALKNNFQKWQQEKNSEQEDTFEAGVDKELLNQLLGNYTNLSTVTALNAKSVYIAFMKNVRALHKTWDKSSWDRAQIIFSELNERKDEVDENIPTEDEIKITALQAEFHALKAGDKVSETVEEL